MSAVARVSEERLRRLRDVMVTAKIRKGLELPERVRIKYDRETEAYVLLLMLPGLAAKEGYAEVLAERSVEVALRWRRPGRTMSFVARHALRVRDLPPAKPKRAL